MIEVNKLTKTFSDKKGGWQSVVDDVSFNAHPGEIFGLLGPNGAGKTTLLRMLASILKPTGGTARICGFDVVRESMQVHGHIGFLSGDMGQYARLTPREVLTFFAKLNRMPNSQAKVRIEEVISELGLESFADRRIDHLSTGMKQKAAIARAIFHDPPVLILDEPTSGLDVLAARHLEIFMNSAKRAGKCVLFSTHLMEEAEQLCDRVAVVSRGTIIATGTIDELRARTGQQRLRDVFLSLLGLDAEVMA